MDANLAALNLLVGRVCVGGCGRDDGSSEVCSNTSPKTYNNYNNILILRWQEQRKRALRGEWVREGSGTDSAGTMDG